jgi:hypothetical protein
VETVSETSTRAERAANLFDLRRIIGGVFVVWGVLLIILGLTDSEEEANKAAGININLYAGIGMLVVGAIFLIWAFTHPLGKELTEAEPASEESSRGAGGDSEGTLRPGDPGGE